ncbi:MAG: CAP domain-containing protein [Lachnospiraceae bacterium]
MKRKILALLLVVIMVFSMMPTSLTGNIIANASEIEDSMDNDLLAQEEASADDFQVGIENQSEEENLVQVGEIQGQSGQEQIITEGSDVIQASAQDTITVNLPLQYGQTEARSILNMINEMRTSSTDAWYWNSDNTTKTICSNLSELAYDYDLEKIAMKRAAEIAMSYDHTRPNGLTCFTAYDISYYAAGENIAAGYTSAVSVNKGWREDNDDYYGQGHRRNMLSNKFNCVGVGHAYYNGVHYWVEEFAYRTSINTATTTANDSEQITPVEAAKSIITGLDVTLNQDSYNLQVNGTTPVSISSNVIASFNGNWPRGKGPVADMPTIGVADTSIATYSEDTLFGVSVGATNLTATLYGYTQNLPYSVNVYDKQPISSCNISLSQTEYAYDGTEKKPEVTVIFDSTILKENVDYTLTYGNNINAGEAYVEVKGINNWAGSERQYFTITSKGIGSLTWILGNTCNSVTQEEQDPSLILKDGTKILVEGIDYEKTYDVNDKKTGGIIWVTGLGNYSEGGIYTGRYYTYHKYYTSQVVEKSTCSKQGIRRWTCNECGKTKDEAIELNSNNHTYNEGAITKEPTCTEKGIKTYTCTGCGTTKTEDVVATGHTLIKTDAKAPTYTEAGNKEYYTCSKCDKSFSDAQGKNETTVSEMIIPALKHDMTRVAAKEATCTELGNKEYYICKECNKIYSDAAGKNETSIKAMTIPVLGHEWSEWKETKKATCTEEGEKERKCSRCNKTETQKVSALGHEWSEWKETKEATCTEEGEKERKCSRCSEIETQKVSALGHEWSEWKETKKATCTEEGEKERKCSRCSEIETQKVSALGHEWSEWKETKKATCTEEGEKERKCSRCSEIETQKVEVLGHELEKVAAKAATCTEAGNKEYYSCKECNKIYSDAAGKNETSVKAMTILALGHEWSEWKEIKKATCTEEGEKERKCSRCSEIETQKVSALGHELEKVAAKEATCTEVGNKEYYSCKECNKIYSDAAGKNETSVKAMTIPALGHEWSEWKETKKATCTEEGEKERKCSRCNKTETQKVSALSHELEKVAAKAATYTEAGNKEYYKCKRCSKLFSDAAGKNETTLKEVTIAPLEKKGQTITGVSSTYTKTYGNSAFSLGAKAKGKLTYKSSNTSIVTVSSSGTVTIKGIGTAKITITAASTSTYKSATKTVTVVVNKASQSITGVSSTYTKTYGNSAFSLGAKAKGKLTYKSSNTSIVTVSSSGTVTIKGIGTAKITITAASTSTYKSATKTVTVVVNKASQSITGVSSTYTKTYGNSAFSLGAKAKGKLTYKSSNTSIVTVSSSGTVTIKGVGTAKITITAASTSTYESATKVVTINVQKISPTIKVKTSSKTFYYSTLKKKAQSFQLGGYANSKGKITYTKSSGSSSLTIDKATGTVTIKKGAKKGTYTAKITMQVAERGNYKSGSKTITIKVIVK